MTTVPEPEGKDLRSRKKQLVREAIIDSALELFARDGFDDTSVQSIADQAGVSAATVARYFPSKEALLFPEREERVASLRAAILNRPRRESPMTAIVAAIVAQPVLTEEHRRRLLLGREAIARSSVLRGRAVGVLDVWRDGIADALVERDGLDSHDANVFATAVLAVLDDVASRWAAAGGTSDLEAACQRAVGVLEPRRRSHT